jgi:hypothetical protein
MKTPADIAGPVRLSKSEGWTYLCNSPKWHYFRAGRALCGRFLLLGKPALEQGMDDHSENCMGCRRKREKETKSATTKDVKDTAKATVQSCQKQVRR